MKIKEDDRERRILKANYSKFIVYIENKNEEFEYLPFFPFGTLSEIGSRFDDKINLSIIDKIVIIIEIATALKDLHSNCEYHGNLCHENIFINSSKDAYLASIYFDRTELWSNSCYPNQLFYYGPELIEQYQNTFLDNEFGFDDLKKNYLCDIYSFGVLIHMIFTETLPRFRFGNKWKQDRIRILEGNYCKFLFSCDNNEVFKDENLDETGNSLIGMKDVIKKCMKNEPEKRYQSFNRLIEAIKELPVYQRNKKEIEFRIKNAVSSKDYKCSLADIVECYYKKRKLALNDIVCFLKTINYDIKIHDDFNFEFNEMKDDVIIKIFDFFGYKKSNSD